MLSKSILLIYFLFTSTYATEILQTFKTLKTSCEACDTCYDGHYYGSCGMIGMRAEDFFQ